MKNMTNVHKKLDRLLERLSKLDQQTTTGQRRADNQTRLMTQLVGEVARMGRETAQLSRETAQLSREAVQIGRETAQIAADTSILVAETLRTAKQTDERVARILARLQQ